MKMQQFVTPIFLGLALALLALGLLFLPAPQVDAAPGAVPTPITGAYSPDGNVFTFLGAKTFTADGRSDPLTLASFERGDFTWTVDQSATNTTTLTLQYSNDGSRWYNGVALVSDNTTDTGDLVQLPVFARYTRIDVNVATTDTITVTVDILAK